MWTKSVKPQSAKKHKSGDKQKHHGPKGRTGTKAYGKVAKSQFGKGRDKSGRKAVASQCSV